MKNWSIYFDKLNKMLSRLCEFIVISVFMVMGSAILIQIVLRSVGQSMIAIIIGKIYHTLN